MPRPTGFRPLLLPGVTRRNGLDFAHSMVARSGCCPPSGCVAGGFQDSLDWRREGFRHVCVFGRCDDPLEPDVLAQTRERIGESRRRLWIPGCPAGGEREALDILLHIGVTRRNGHRFTLRGRNGNIANSEAICVSSQGVDFNIFYVPNSTGFCGDRTQAELALNFQICI